MKWIEIRFISLISEKFFLRNGLTLSGSQQLALDNQHPTMSNKQQLTATLSIQKAAPVTGQSGTNSSPDRLWWHKLLFHRKFHDWAPLRRGRFALIILKGSVQ